VQYPELICVLITEEEVLREEKKKKIKKKKENKKANSGSVGVQAPCWGCSAVPPSAGQHGCWGLEMGFGASPLPAAQ